MMKYLFVVAVAVVIVGASAAHASGQVGNIDSTDGQNSEGRVETPSTGGSDGGSTNRPGSRAEKLGGSCNDQARMGGSTNDSARMGGSTNDVFERQVSTQAMGGSTN